MDLKVGKKVWVINKSEPIEVSIRFVGDREVAYEFDGKLETKKVKDLFETKEAAEAALKGLLMVVFCREVSRTSGEISVYPIDSEIDGGLSTALRIRGRMNPELTYGVCMKTFFDEHKEEMKDMETLQEMFDYNNVVLL